MAIDRSDEFLTRLAEGNPELVERVIGRHGLPRVVAAAPHIAEALSA